MSSAFSWIVGTIMLLLCINANSQKIFFEQITTAEGLPSDYVNCVFEDSKGYLWMGTDKGACRYDGRQFQLFNNDNGLSSNFVSCFAEDSEGNIWIGTINSGLCKYDGEKIIPLIIPENKNAHIIKIHFNEDNSFFILASQPGTRNSGQSIIVLYFFKDQLSQPQVFQDMAFLKLLKPGLFITGSINQLYVIELKNKQALFHPLTHPKVEAGHFLYWLGDNRIIASTKNSILEYNTDGNRWSFTREFPVSKMNLLPDWTVIKDLLINNDELFVATANGLIYIDNDNKEHLFKSENGLGVNYVQSVYKDRRQNIYISTYGAGIKIWPTRYLEEYETNGKVTSIFSSADKAYITTTKSVYQFDFLLQQFYEFKSSNTGSFTSIYEDQIGNVYLGTLNNFYKLIGQSFSNDNSRGLNIRSFKANTGTSGFISFNKNIYIGTYGDGIYKFDDRTEKIDTLHASTNPKAPLIVESLVPLLSSFAALTYNSGLTIYEADNGYRIFSKKEGMLSNTVYCVFQEKENEVWIGTQNGLNLMRDQIIIKTFTIADGLKGTKVLCLFRDAGNRFWILSDKFLHLLDSNKLRAIRSHPILYDEKNSINRATYNAKTNTLFIGLTDALLSVNMNKVIADTVVDIPTLIAVKRDSTILLPDHAEVISLTRSASNVLFQFDHKYLAGHRSELYYKLSGFDNDWKLLTNSNEIAYQKLPAGDYELIAKTINSDGYESVEFSLLKLQVLPPWWKRTWVILLAAVLLLGIFFYTGKMISRRRYHRKLQQLQEGYRLQLERERIARELHDNVGSQLTYLINKIDDDYPKLAEKNEAEKLSGFARGAMQELRETIWALDKKEVQWDDLENKIRQLLLLYRNEKHDVELEWQINGHQPPLNPLEALNIYRIIQEALNNAEKYSKANNIKVSAHFDNSKVCVEITDNGKGFDNEKTEKGYGLKNMKKRAEEMNAGLHIESEPDRGTTVKLYL